MRSRSTLQRIAEKVGVSSATVSRTLNGQPGVSDNVRERALKAARELAYAPNLPARSLATSVTQTVAFVVHETNHEARDDPFYPIIMADAQAYLAECNYHILLTTLNDRAMRRPETFSVVSEKRVDGLILAGPEIATPLVLAMLSAEIPVVLVDNCLSQTPINCVLNDDEPSAYAVAQHLLEHGHKPQETWELKGDVPNVVFSAANPVVDGVVHIYYGAADRLVGLATCSLAEVLDWVRQAGRS